MTFKRQDTSSSYREPSEAECAYIGAMLDGEGNTPRRRAGYGQLIIDNSDHRIIDRLVTYTGIGKVYTYQPTNGTRPMFKWQVSKHADLLRLLPLLTPWSSKAGVLLNWIRTPRQSDLRTTGSTSADIHAAVGARTSQKKATL